MIHTKQLYEAPAANLLVVRFEENIMSLQGFGSAKQAGGGMKINDLGEDEEDLY